MQPQPFLHNAPPSHRIPDSPLSTKSPPPQKLAGGLYLRWLVEPPPTTVSTRPDAPGRHGVTAPSPSKTFARVTPGFWPRQLDCRLHSHDDNLNLDSPGYRHRRETLITPSHISPVRSCNTQRISCHLAPTLPSPSPSPSPLGTHPPRTFTSRRIFFRRISALVSNLFSSSPPRPSPNTSPYPDCNSFTQIRPIEGGLSSGFCATVRKGQGRMHVTQRWRPPQG